MSGDMAATSGPRVLVLGYRQGLCRALRRQRIPYVVWNDAPLRFPPRHVTVHVAPFGRDREQSRAAAAAIAQDGPFTHVIAAVERSVVAASHARRVLGARLSTHTTVMRCHDKLLMKETLRAAGVPVTDFVGGEAGSAEAAYALLGPRMVVKDRTESGGRGLQIVRSQAEAKALSMDGRLAERFVEGREVSVESFVRAGRVCFTNVTEYVKNGSINLVPGDLPEATTTALLSIHARVVEALRITWGITHCEFYLTADGPVVGEIALRPPGGYIMELLELAYGFSAWDALVAIELGLPYRFVERASAHAGVVIFHPGAGRVRALRGFDRIEAHPLVERAKLKIAIGDVLSPRKGVGEDVGYALLRGKDAAAVRAELFEVERALTVELAP